MTESDQVKNRISNFVESMRGEDSRRIIRNRDSSRASATPQRGEDQPRNSPESDDPMCRNAEKTFLKERNARQMWLNPEVM